MFKNFSKTLIVMVFTMSASMLTTIILGRTLSPEGFGEFALFRNLAILGSSLSVLGMHSSYIKLNLAKIVGRTFYLKVLSIILVSGSLSVIVFHFIYFHQNIYDLFLWLSIIPGALVLIISAHFRLIKRFLIAQVFQGGWKIVLLVVLILIVIIQWHISVNNVVISLSGSMLVFSIYYLKMIFTKKNNNVLNNSGHIFYNIRKYILYGSVFAAIDGLQLIFGRLDKILIPLFLNNEIMGYYIAVSFIYTISFTMIGSAVGVVLFPSISIHEKIPWKKVLKAVVGGAVLGSAVLLSVGKLFVHIAYSGKYDMINTTYFIILFTLLGVLQYLQPIIHFIILGKATNRILILYLSITLFSIIFFIIMYIAVNHYYIIDIRTITNLAVAGWVLKIALSGILLLFISCSNIFVKFKKTLNISMLIR